MNALRRLIVDTRNEFANYESQAAMAYKATAIGTSAFSGNSSGGMMAGGRESSAAKEFYSEFKGWVYVAINTIARRAAGQPVCVARVSRSEKSKLFSTSRKVPQRYREKLNDGQSYEMLEDHQALSVFDHPNPVQGRWEFTYTTIANLYITGTFYWIAGESKEGGVELWAIPSSWIRPKHEDRLFSGYLLTLPGEFEPWPLEYDQVVRGFLPDPANPLKGAISPVGTQWPAVKIDGKIQKSQEVAYDNGLFPSLAVAVGQNIGPEGKPTGEVPLLEPEQRAQIINAVRRLVGGVYNSGEPLILDALIEKVFPIENKPREMDWLHSGEQIKTRIFQAFGLNPINAGEIAGVNRAQAAVADQQMCSGTTNPILDIMSDKATYFARRRYQDDSLCVWWMPCVPNDEELRLKQNEMLLKYNVITKGEARSEYGFPPMEEVSDRPAILDTAAAAGTFAQILSFLNENKIQREQAIALIDEFVPGAGGRIVGGESKPVEPDDGMSDGGDDEGDGMDEEGKAALSHVMAMLSGSIGKAWSVDGSALQVSGS